MIKAIFAVNSSSAALASRENSSSPFKAKKLLKVFSIYNNIQV